MAKVVRFDYLRIEVFEPEESVYRLTEEELWLVEDLFPNVKTVYRAWTSDYATLIAYQLAESCDKPFQFQGGGNNVVYRFATEAEMFAGLMDFDRACDCDCGHDVGCENKAHGCEGHAPTCEVRKADAVAKL